MSTWLQVTERRPTSTSQRFPHTHVPTPVGCPNNTNTNPNVDRNCTLEEAMKTIVNLYHQIAPEDQKDDYFSPKDFKRFMHLQAPTFLQACGRDRPGYLEELFKKLDVDQSGHLTFEEFTPALLMIIDDAHRMSHGEDRCGPERD